MASLSSIHITAKGASSTATYPEWELLPSSPDDLLSLDQKRRIYEFVRSYLLTDADTEERVSSPGKAVKQSLVPLGYEHVLKRNSDTADPVRLETIRAAIDQYHISKGNGKTFESFRRVFKDPRLGSGDLGIDATKDDQVFATQMFMKVIIDNINTSEGFESIFFKYMTQMGFALGPRDPSSSVFSAAPSLTAVVIENSYSSPSIPGDPLSLDQKEKIYAFVQSYLLSDVETEVDHYGWRRIVKQPLVGLGDDAAVAKTYDTFDPIGLERSQLAVDGYDRSKADGKTFDAFRKVFKDPRLGSADLGIDGTKDDQVFAAQMFMKVIIKNTNWHKDFEQLLSEYINKMGSAGSEGEPDAIREKNRLLMENDPVEKQDPRVAQTPLSLLLSNLYFQDQQRVAQYNGNLPDGTLLHRGELYGPTREEVRGEIKKMIVGLYAMEEVKHVIHALTALIKREKANIFFWGDEGRARKLWSPYRFEMGTVGMYLKHHTIIMSGKFDTIAGNLPYGKMGTFVHESLHFLFNRILKNASSPVETGSEQERLLDEALAKDRALRERIRGNTLEFTRHEGSVWGTFKDLEEGYFTHGFNPFIPSHLELMRVESIVRIMEQVASGVPLETIRKFAPNLCEFYFTYSKPILERYARGEEV